MTAPPHVCTYTATKFDASGMYVSSASSDSLRYVLPAGMTAPDGASAESMRAQAQASMGLPDAHRARVVLTNVTCQPLHASPATTTGGAPASSSSSAASSSSSLAVASSSSSLAVASPAIAPPAVAPVAVAPPAVAPSAAAPTAVAPSLAADAARLTGVMQRNMSTSCAPQWDVGDATQMQHYTCHYRGPVRDAEGRTRTVRLTRLTGRLASCDGSVADREQTHEDIISVVAHRLGGAEGGVQRDAITCDVMTMPMST